MPPTTPSAQLVAGLLLSCILAGLGWASPAQAQDLDPHGWVDHAIQVMREHALMSADVDWDAVSEEAHRRVAVANTALDVYDAIRYVIGRLGDRHSHLRPAPAEAAAYRARLREQAETGPAESAPDTTFWRRRAVEATDLAVGGMLTRWVVVPGFSGDPAAAASFAATLYRAITAEPRACGFILDFRGNTGGNMWPMLAGISPLLEDGDLGGFSGPRESSAIFHREGRVGVREADGEAVIHAIEDWAAAPHLAAAPVAVLIDGGAASSGEITPIMLVGRQATRFFGSPTAGIATAIRPFPLPDGAMLMLTVADVSDRQGKRYREPLQPDVSVANPAPGSAEDPPLEAALAWLRVGACDGVDAPTTFEP